MLLTKRDYSKAKINWVDQKLHYTIFINKLTITFTVISSDLFVKYLKILIEHLQIGIDLLEIAAVIFIISLKGFLINVCISLLGLRDKMIDNILNFIYSWGYFGSKYIPNLLFSYLLLIFLFFCLLNHRFIRVCDSTVWS